MKKIIIKNKFWEKEQFCGYDEYGNLQYETQPNYIIIYILGFSFFGFFMLGFTYIVMKYVLPLMF